MSGDAIAERLAGSLGEAHGDPIRRRRGEQALRQLLRQASGDDEFANHAGGALGMARPHRVMPALLDRAALLRHALDDALDGALLVGRGMLDVVAVAEVCHGAPWLTHGKRSSPPRVLERHDETA